MTSFDVNPEMLQELAEAVEPYGSWVAAMASLRRHAPKGNAGEILRYPALRLRDLPDGNLGEWLVQVLNVFGSLGEKEEGKIPRMVARERLQALLCSEMGVTAKITKQRVQTLIDAGLLRQHYGNVPFPIELLVSCAPEG